LRTYDADAGRSVVITPEIAICAIKLANFDADTSLELDLDVVSPAEIVLLNSLALDDTYKNTNSYMHLLINAWKFSTQGPPHSRDQLICFRVFDAARSRTYVFLLRWLRDATKEKLAALWTLLHGYPTTVNVNLNTDQYAFPADWNKALLDASSYTKLTPFERLAERYEQRMRVHRLVKENNLHRKMNEKINVFIRTPNLEEKSHNAPLFAACTASLSLSCGFSDYVQFREAMDAAIEKDVAFTING
jgi:hypothetical protein